MTRNERRRLFNRIACHWCEMVDAIDELIEAGEYIPDHIAELWRRVADLVESFEERSRDIP